MPGRVWRTNRNKLLPILLDKLSDVLAVEGRHVPRAAMRAVIVAHAGPLIGPYPLAAGASVEIQKPSHANRPKIRKR